MHICFVVEGYPIKEDPFMPFVRELAAEMVRQGTRVSVIAPQSITRARLHRLPVRPRFWRDEASEGKFIEVYQPHYYTLSDRLPWLNKKSCVAAVRRAFGQIKEPVDALYAHFWHMGVVASKIKTDIPVFVACGESRIEVRDSWSKEEIEYLLGRLAGNIYVGTKSLNDSKQLDLQRSQPYIIAPNGYDPSVFKKLDKKTVRGELGWDEDAYTVSFVGAFSPRKGVDRLCEAIKKTGIKTNSCFVGSGDIKPYCEGILFEGRAPHEDVVRYLNASDVFVLPTNNEGCCNAIVEALACGLPVISSDQSFNDDILDENCSLRIDPMNIDAIAEAIKTLTDPDLRAELSDGALKKAAGLSLPERAKKITDFITERLR